MTTRLLTASDEALQKFNDDGFLMLRDFLEPEIVEGVRNELKNLADEHIAELAGQGKATRLFPDEPFETRYARVYENTDAEPPTVFRTELHREAMYRLFFNRHLLDLVTGILGPEIRLYPNYSARPKLPDNVATQVLWHQDAGYTEDMGESKDGSVDELRMVNVWSPVVPATVENGCMQFIPGTHKLGAVKHVRKNKFYLEIAEEELNPRLSEAIDVEMNPGDIVLFSNLLFHRGMPNRTNKIRWSCDWRYQDATQSTMRKDRGHIARSARNADEAVKSARQWAELSFV